MYVQGDSRGEVYIQGDLKGKGDILGCDSASHFEKIS